MSEIGRGDKGDPGNSPAAGDSLAVKIAAILRARKLGYVLLSFA